MLPLGRSKGTQRAAQGSGAASQGRRREGQGGAQNSQDAAMATEDAAMGLEDFVDEEAGPEAEFEALLEKRVHTDYDKEFGDDFDDEDI
mmetsp:Transcript_13225/g.36458  ORF Transcript_13225/g.36458 Transcript_13225/m.36458 type:complete len:89 (+) Transcript_13225:79-345(+)